MSLTPYAAKIKHWMSKTNAAPKKTPPAKNGEDKKSSADLSLQAQSMFLAMALNMTWQLAIVVIVPIVGGHFLDEALGTDPWLTVIGMVVAGLGVVGVLMRIVKIAGQKTGKPGSKN